MARRKKNSNYYRALFQGGIILLLIYMVLKSFLFASYTPDFEAYCPFGGMQSLASYFATHSLACSMTTVQIALGIALILAVVLLSKLFCSYICPIGTLTEWLGSLGRKVKLQFTLKGFWDRMLRLLKYVLLFITFYFTVTESELFCRKFDPYYAGFTGFSSDVIIWYALPALILVVIGSFFIRQFWCKYLCPLGAITNLAVYALPASAITLLWVLLTYAAGLSIPWPWLLGALCLAGFLFEATTLRYFVFPSLRITRNDTVCTHCRICDKICPMAVPISQVEKVEHIDCHLCADCIVSCPEKGALTINKREMTWLPAVATTLLIAASITIGTYFELPTISESWGATQGKNIHMFKMDGLKNIKCFGSSRSFANHMKEIPGITGVETFVKHHRVLVYYDSTVIQYEGVKQAIFTPLNELLNYDGNTADPVNFIEIGIDRCFDPNDQAYLAALLKQDTGVLAISTRFGEPVQATIYFKARLTNENKILTQVTEPELVSGEGKDKTIVETGFKVNETGKKSGTIAGNEFAALFIPGTDISFNGYENYAIDDLLVYEIPFAEASDPDMQKWIPYLVSHASNDDGIVRIRTEFTIEGPVLKVWFVGKLTNVVKINAMLKASEFLVHFPDKSVKKVKNPFRFPV